MPNTSGDAGNEYFSDGLSEELISSLSRLSDLKVIGRTSSFQFKGKTDDSASIGQKLGVVYLLEGSVRKSADRVRIAAELVKSADGANVWSESYDRELKDIFAVQSEIAGMVASQLQVALLGKNAQPAPVPVAAPSNQNFDAYTAYLQGNAYALRHTGQDLRKAIDYYEEAVRLDTHYALAYANLADAQVQLVTIFSVTDRAQREALIAEARDNSARALALDPNLGKAQQSAAFILEVVDFELAAADKGYRRATELSPQDAGTWLNLAVVNASLGRVEEAAGYGRRSVTLDPLNSGNYVYFRAHARRARPFRRGRNDFAQGDRVSAAGGAELYGARDHQDPARQTRRPLWNLPGRRLTRSGASTRSRLPKPRPAIDWKPTRHSRRCSTVMPTPALSRLPRSYALRKEPDKMFEWLEHGLTTRDPGVTPAPSSRLSSAPIATIRVSLPFAEN